MFFWNVNKCKNQIDANISSRWITIAPYFLRRMHRCNIIFFKFNIRAPRFIRTPGSITCILSGNWKLTLHIVLYYQLIFFNDTRNLGTDIKKTDFNHYIQNNFSPLLERVNWTLDLPVPACWTLHTFARSPSVGRGDSESNTNVIWQLLRSHEWSTPLPAPSSIQTMWMLKSYFLRALQRWNKVQTNTTYHSENRENGAVFLRAAWCWWEA